MRLNHWSVIRLLGFMLFALMLFLPTLVFAEVDITDKVEIIKGRMTSDRRTGDALIDVSIKNISSELYFQPVKVVVDQISSPTVTVANADGFTDDGKPFFLYSGVGDVFEPNEISLPKRFILQNPNRVRFSYLVKVFGIVPDAAKFIGSNGGVIEVTDLDSPLLGLKVEIPSGALEEGRNITIEIVDSNPGFSNEVSGLSPMVEIGPSGTIFTEPISITLPYVKQNLSSEKRVILEETLKIYTKDDTTGLWYPLETVNIDTEEGEITAKTNHLSPFVVNGDTLIRHSDLLPTDNLPVLFLHGISVTPFSDHIGDCYKTFGETYDGGAINLIYEKGFNVYSLNYETSKSINDSAASLLLAIAKIKFQTGADRINIIAHSMGGLVSRAYVQNRAFFEALPDINASYRNDISKILMIATPNHGALISHIPSVTMVSANQMIPGSDFLNALNNNPINNPELAIDVVYSVVEPPNSWFDFSSIGDTVVSTKSAILTPEQDISKLKHYREHFLTGYYHNSSIAQVNSEDHLAFKIMEGFVYDSDSDGVTDLGGRDFCLNTPNSETVDNNGCSFSQVKPSLLFPENDSIDQPSQLSFKWKKLAHSGSVDSLYCLRIYNLAETVYEACGEADSQKNISLSPGETYYWTVQAEKGDSPVYTSLMSDIRKFTVAQDYDFDGFSGSSDCAPTDPNIYPGAVEVCGNTIDENCSGTAAPFNQCEHNLSFYHDSSMKFTFSAKDIIDDNQESQMKLRLLSGSGCWYMVTPNYNQDGSYVDEHEVRYLPPYGDMTINDNFIIRNGEYFQLDISRNQIGSNALVAIDVLLRGVWGKKLEDLVLEGASTREKISLIVDLLSDSGVASNIDTGTLYLFNGETLSAIKEYIVAFNKLVDLGYNDALKDYFFQGFGVVFDDLWDKSLENILQAMSLPDKWFLLREITENYIRNPGPLNGYSKISLNIDCVTESCSGGTISESLSAGFGALISLDNFGNTASESYLSAIDSFLNASDFLEFDSTATQNEIDQTLFFSSLARLAQIADPYSDLTENGLNNLGDILDAFGIGGTNDDRDYLNQIPIEDCSTVVDWTDPDTGYQYTHEECSLKEISADSPTSGELQQFLTDKVVSELQIAIENLGKVSPTFNKEWIDPSDNTVTEFDYADALAVKGFMQAMLAQMKLTNAYNFDVNLADEQQTANSGQELSPGDFLSLHPSLGALEDPASLNEAKTYIELSANTLISAINTMDQENSGGDDQSDDFISFYSCGFNPTWSCGHDSSESSAMKDKLVDVARSMVLSTDIDFKSPVDGNVYPLTVRFFNIFNGLDIRNQLPVVTDNTTGFFPDPTLNGVIDPTQFDINEDKDADGHPDLANDFTNFFEDLVSDKQTYGGFNGPEGSSTELFKFHSDHTVEYQWSSYDYVTNQQHYGQGDGQWEIDSSTKELVVSFSSPINTWVADGQMDSIRVDLISGEYSGGEVAERHFLGSTDLTPISRGSQWWFSEIQNYGLLPQVYPPGGLNAFYRESDDWNYVTWYSVYGAAEYRVYWGTEPGVDKNSEMLTYTTTTDYGHSGVVSGYTYYYRVSAVGYDGVESDLSNEVSVFVPFEDLAVEAPFITSAYYQSSLYRNYVSWTPVSGASQYRVYWGTEPGVDENSEMLTPTASTTYGHTGVLGGYTYYYRVSAVSSAGIESDLSSVVGVSVPLAYPDAVSVIYQVSNDWNYITWNPVSGACQYDVYWGTEPGVDKNSEMLTPTTTTDYGHSGVVSGYTYYYRVSSVGCFDGIESDLSTERSVFVP